MKLNTDFLDDCIQILEAALDRIQAAEGDDVTDAAFRAACVKQFEIIQEQCGSLLKKRLRPYFASNRQADELAFKPIFRHATRHGLISVEECERWLEYRDHRNDTAHERGEAYTDATIELVPTILSGRKATHRDLGRALR